MIHRTLFSIFEKHPDLIYLDSAATSLKPTSVLSATRAYEEVYSANIARGLYPIAEVATDAFEAARKKVARFIHADPKEIIFTSGTTHGINLTAQLLDPLVKSGDNIIVTELEHHSNFLPWKELAQRKNAEFRIVPFTKEGLIDIETLSSMIDNYTRVVAFSAISNVMGGINPTSEIIRIVKEKNPECITVVDAAQAAGHIDIDTTKWNADFIAFSGHKMYGPTGTGVLYGKENILEHLPPTTFGGGMVTDACADVPEYREIPHRFEAGTPNISGVIGLGAAIDYIVDTDMKKIREHDLAISKYAIEKLHSAFGDSIRILGPTDIDRRSALISFTIDGIHPHDLAALLGEKNICIRAGEHCAAPLHRKLNLSATARISFGIYTTEEDIDRLITEMKNIQKFIG
ncbi:MAG: Cysteine desulfurase [Patescibacteria group bacterium]|nr:Cysteine desulfurase [Patescibacteria group bacterium]